MLFLPTCSPGCTSKNQNFSCLVQGQSANRQGSGSRKDPRTRAIEIFPAKMMSKKTEGCIHVHPQHIFFCSCGRSPFYLWWCPKFRVPPVMNHFKSWDFPKSSSYWATPIHGNPYMDYMEVSWNGATPQSSISIRHFPWTKPSSYGGTPIDGNHLLWIIYMINPIPLNTP